MFVLSELIQMGAVEAQKCTKNWKHLQNIWLETKSLCVQSEHTFNISCLRP